MSLITNNGAPEPDLFATKTGRGSFIYLSEQYSHQTRILFDTKRFEFNEIK